MFEYKCKLVKVVDGDTVDVDIDLGFGVWLQNQRIRLYGIDTPESRTRDKVEKRFGLLAKEFVEDFFKIGDVILTTKKYDAKGKFGRILGDFKCNGRTLSKVMIEMHHAVEYHGQSKEDIREAHLANRRKVKI